MRIDTLRLRNFCCFEDREFSLAERFNLLVGDNGSGKTSVLDGLSVGLSAWLAGLHEPTGTRSIGWEDVRFRSYLQGDTYTRERQFPTGVFCRGFLDGQAGEWIQERYNRDSQDHGQGTAWIEALTAALAAKVRAGEPALLPVIAYYGTGRLWLRKGPRSIEPLSPGSRFLGYLDCLDPASDEKRLLAWFKTREIQALQENKTVAVLEAVRQAIRACIEDATHVYFNVARDELLLRFADREIPFDYLSDGYRNMLAMVADIAVRCATLNPALKEQAIRDTPGVVLIDEIDLHLHPRWQRRVVNDLLKAFPAVQFVATTHSPFIIQSLVPKEGIRLINLDNPAANDFADKSVEDISEEVQGVPLPQRSQRFQDMMQAARRYYAKLGEAKNAPAGELARLRRELDELMLPFSDDPAYQAFLQMQRAAAGIDGGNGHAAG